MTEPTEQIEESGTHDTAPDAGNTEHIDTLTTDVDPDDDVYQRVAMVNTCQPDVVEQAPDDTQ